MSIQSPFFSRITYLVLTSIFCLFLLAACGSGGSTPQPQSVTQAVAQTEPSSAQPTDVPSPLASTPLATTASEIEPTQAESTSVAATTPEIKAMQFDACTLLDKAEVEAAAGKEVLEGKNEIAGNLACCSYGDSETPIFTAASVCVYVGDEAGYYAGGEAAAHDLFEMAKGNAESPLAVSGVGEDAYWTDTFSELNVLQGSYEFSVNIERNDEDSDALLQVSKELAQKILERLP